MNELKKYLVFVLLSLIELVKSQNDYKCLDSRTHKPEPTPETALYGECKNWQSLSCCNFNTTETFHLVDNWLGFNYNHCGQISEACKNKFKKELCLYECDPFLGNWIVKDESKLIRNERYYQIPLCKKDCDSWFDACKDDYTCRDNWNRGFKWINRINYCPANEKCETFAKKFRTAENFCNQIWDESFLVPNENDTNFNNCFSFDFDSSQNPNKLAAAFYDASVNTATTIFMKFSYFFILFGLFSCTIF